MKRMNIKCPYCGARAVLRPASAIGKTKPCYDGQKFYVCARYPSCDSYVAAHSKSGLPMGSLADRRLRWLRRDAHEALEQFCRERNMNRSEGYQWLGMQLGIPAEDAHIGKFSEFRCNAVIRMCGQFDGSRAA